MFLVFLFENYARKEDEEMEFSKQKQG